MEASAPGPWEGDVVLADGGTVHVRPIRPEDAEGFRAFHGALSPQSVYYRFFSPKPRLSDAEVERFTTVDMVDRVALVAVLGDDIVADARYDRWPGKDEAEVAFAVADEHQGRGLSTLLLEHLAAIARVNGIARFTAEVLADNRPMLSVFARAGWPLSREFDSGVVDVVFDIVPTPDYLNTVERREQRAESRSIARLLRPRSIAVVGASDETSSVGRALMQNLLGSGFPGPVYAVNPAHQQVANMVCYPSLRDVPDDVALAIVAVPPDQVSVVLDDAIAKHVRGLVMITGDLPEAAPGEPAMVRQLVTRARGNGMRIVGPASMGFLTTAPDFPVRATLVPTRVTHGGVSISLQSGPLGTGILELASRLGVGLSSFVSLGDKADVSGNDLLQLWEDDPATTVVLVYTESFGNPRKFARIAQEGVAAQAHRHGARRRLGRSDDRGAVRAGRRHPGQDGPRAARHGPDPGRPAVARGNRVMVVSNAVSPAILALDAAQRGGSARGRARRRPGRRRPRPAPCRLPARARRAAAHLSRDAGRLQPCGAVAPGGGRGRRAGRDLRPSAPGPECAARPCLVGAGAQPHEAVGDGDGRPGRRPPGQGLAHPGLRVPRARRRRLGPGGPTRREPA